MKRKLFNKYSREDLHRLGNLMNAKFKIESLQTLHSPDAVFARSIMYWYDHHVGKSWGLPTWAHMPDFQGWLANFRNSYRVWYAFERDYYEARE